MSSSDVFRKDPLKNRPESQASANKSTPYMDSQERVGRLVLSKRGTSLVLYIGGEYIGWIGKYTVSDVIKHKRNLAYIYRGKEETKKGEGEHET